MSRPKKPAILWLLILGAAVFMGWVAFEKLTRVEPKFQKANEAIWYDDGDMFGVNIKEDYSKLEHESELEVAIQGRSYDVLYSYQKRFPGARRMRKTEKPILLEESVELSAHFAVHVSKWAQYRIRGVHRKVFRQPSGEKTTSAAKIDKSISGNISYNARTFQVRLDSVSHEQSGGFSDDFPAMTMHCALATQRQFECSVDKLPEELERHLGPIPQSIHQKLFSPVLASEPMYYFIDYPDKVPYNHDTGERGKPFLGDYFRPSTLEQRERFHKIRVAPLELPETETP
jgi:hypothetical protein